MTKNFNKYSISINASANSGQLAQILFYNNTQFVGRIDFQANSETLGNSYLWHPGSIVPDQTYIVLRMHFSAFATVAELLRTEGPWSVTLWPSKTLSGAATDGYGGKLQTAGMENVGEGEFNPMA